MDLFGPNYILSPSHEALLKNVSTKNLTAMAKAAKH
jgi:uroporphyrinogen decarboxylase